MSVVEPTTRAVALLTHDFHNRSWRLPRGIRFVILLSYKKLTGQNARRGHVKSTPAARRRTVRTFDNRYQAIIILVLFLFLRFVRICRHFFFLQLEPYDIIILTYGYGSMWRSTDTAVPGQTERRMRDDRRTRGKPIKEETMQVDAHALHRIPDTDRPVAQHTHSSTDLVSVTHAHTRTRSRV